MKDVRAACWLMRGNFFGEGSSLLGVLLAQREVKLRPTDS